MFSILKKAAFVSILGMFFLLSSHADAAIIQPNGTGQYQSEVISDNGWTNNFGAGEVDFWILHLTEESKISVAVLSDIVFGFSLYRGEMLLDPGMLFSNYSDFFGFAGESLTYLTGTDPFTPLSGGSLVDFILSAGSYTLAVGGNDFGFDSTGRYQYTLDLLSQPTKVVSSPATATMLLLACVMLLRQQRRR